MTYRAPLEDITTALDAAVDLDDLIARDLYAGLDRDTMNAVIEEAGNFAADVLAPLNGTGDQHGSSVKDGVVTTAPGFKDAYRRFVDAGWTALPCAEEHGGQGLPDVVALSVSELWNAANLSFGLCPLLTQGAIHAIETGGSDEMKARYLPNMVSGRWTGTMNLTEPHAGSDLSLLRSRAISNGDGTYRITGTKIFITFGEHDFAENIIHLVLARLPDAPEGTRGISLFLVPKFLVNEDGSLGERNDVICAGVEHKLGIKASPTCIMQFGDNGGAIGYLVGEENRGLANMFVMMNAARINVGIQGVAVADRAYQRALLYAQERRQGRSAHSSGPGMSPIVEHPDVRRMLMTMKATTQAARMICLATARELDISHRDSDPAVRAAAANRAALLTPIAKSFSTDIGVEMSSIGIQVHGGMGFVEETGAAQHLRDSRILPIYEGTNGIQAMDLVMRKLPLEGGAVVGHYLTLFGTAAAALMKSPDDGVQAAGRNLAAAVAGLKRSSEWIGGALKGNTEAALASAAPYLRQFALVAGGGFHARALANPNATASARATALFFLTNILPEANGLEAIVTGGAAALSFDQTEAALS